MFMRLPAKTPVASRSGRHERPGAVRRRQDQASRPPARGTPVASCPGRIRGSARTSAPRRERRRSDRPPGFARPPRPPRSRAPADSRRRAPARSSRWPAGRRSRSPSGASADSAGVNATWTRTAVTLSGQATIAVLVVSQEQTQTDGLLPAPARARPRSPARAAGGRSAPTAWCSRRSGSSARSAPVSRPGQEGRGDVFASKAGAGTGTGGHEGAHRPDGRSST